MKARNSVGFTLVALIAVILPSGVAWGQVTVANAGFEEPFQPIQGFSSMGVLTGWTGSFGTSWGTIYPNASMFSGGAPEGNQVAYTNGADLCQVVGTVANNETYSADVNAGWRDNVASPGPECGIVLRSTSGVRCSQTVFPTQDTPFTALPQCTFTAAPSDADNGQPLTLCLTVVSGAQCNFDIAGATPVELLEFSID